MSQLKNSLVLFMYVYIFFIAIKTGNVPITVFSIVLIINYLNVYTGIKSFNKIIKKELNTQKERFINLLSHDIRIPTIAQIRALELLQNEKLGELTDIQKEMLLQIEDSCKCILNLMSLMINTYNMENDKYSLIYERFNLSEIIVSCFDELISKASEKQITFEYENKTKDIIIIADKTELRKVIINILSTSVMNANVGEKVTVSVLSFNGKIRLSFICRNNCYFSGIGEYTEYTSIGQSIRMGFCKKIIENHHGKILKNRNNNLFSFELPKYAFE